MEKYNSINKIFYIKQKKNKIKNIFEKIILKNMKYINLFLEYKCNLIFFNVIKSFNYNQFWIDNKFNKGKYY